MADATSHAHSHAHRHEPAHAHDGPHAGRRGAARLSLLESSAAARLLSVSAAVAALWIGVFWALH